MDATNKSGTKTEVELVPTEVLISELQKRHCAFVFLGIIFKTQSQYTIIRRFNGHRHVCLGMLSNMASIINEYENKNLGPTIE